MCNECILIFHAGNPLFTNELEHWNVRLLHCIYFLSKLRKVQCLNHAKVIHGRWIVVVFVTEDHFVVLFGDPLLVGIKRFYKSFKPRPPKFSALS